MPPSPPVITRFAPSPTGHLHIGGARTALFCWAFAKRNRGHFILRIEDTDQARSSDESARGIMEDLAWLGIEWDEGPELKARDGRTIGGDPRGVGPFFQARRMHLYNKYIARLVEEGKAYPAFETSDQLEAKRKAAAAAKQTFRYDRAALKELPTVQDRLKRMATGESHVIRLLAPPDEIVVHDQVLGDVRYAAGELDDFVIRKADGFPTYHFAVVVDDETMGVTHVLRAQEHLNNTPRHVALQRALGFRTPTYGHMPLIFNMDASKMSKRDKAKAARKAAKEGIAREPALRARLESVIDARTLDAFLAADIDTVEVAEKVADQIPGLLLPEVEVYDFRDSGYTPEAITNFLGLLGWNPGMKTPDGKDLEKFDSAFIAEHFAIDRIGKGNAKFDRKKLESFNADYLAALPEPEFARRLRAWCAESGSRHASTRPLCEKLLALPDQKLAWLAGAIRPRTRKFADVAASIAFLARSDTATDFDPKAVEKSLRADNNAGLTLLRDLRAFLDALSDWTPASIHAFLESTATARGFTSDKGPNIGPIAQPLRIAIAGSAVTPPLGETLAILGRDSTLKRIDTCLARIA